MMDACGCVRFSLAETNGGLLRGVRIAHLLSCKKNGLSILQVSCPEKAQIASSRKSKLLPLGIDRWNLVGPRAYFNEATSVVRAFYRLHSDIAGRPYTDLERPFRCRKKTQYHLRSGLFFSHPDLEFSEIRPCKQHDQCFRKIL